MAGVTVAHEWLLHEIEGLRDFAAMNGLPKLAEALEQARLVAALELGQAEGDDRPGGAGTPG